VWGTGAVPPHGGVLVLVFIIVACFGGVWVGQCGSWVGAEYTGLVTPMTGLHWAPPPVVVVVQVDCKVDWKAEFVM